MPPMSGIALPSDTEAHASHHYLLSTNYGPAPGPTLVLHTVRKQTQPRLSGICSLLGAKRLHVNLIFFFSDKPRSPLLFSFMESSSSWFNFFMRQSVVTLRLLFTRLLFAGALQPHPKTSTRKQGPCLFCSWLRPWLLAQGLAFRRSGE